MIVKKLKENKVSKIPKYQIAYAINEIPIFGVEITLYYRKRNASRKGIAVNQYYTKGIILPLDRKALFNLNRITHES
jgi:hypothetical protein